MKARLRVVGVVGQERSVNGVVLVAGETRP